MATILVIEWDGEKPPTTWYNRLAKHNISVRGKTDSSGYRISNPEERRSFSGVKSFWSKGFNQEEISGTIVQEGCVITASRSFAVYLASLAKQCGAKSVHIGDTQLEKYQTSTNDAKTLQRIEGILGSRGRPMNGSTFDYVITCIECGAVNAVKDSKGVIGCPSCRAVRVKYRMGELMPISLPKIGTLFSKWLSHRFLFRSFEPVHIEQNGMEPPTIAIEDVTDESEMKVLKLIEKSTILSKLDKIDLELAFSILDSIFIARTYLTEEERIDIRSQAAFTLFRSGIKQDKIDIIEPNIPDSLDALAFGYQNAVSLFHVLNSG